MLYKGSVLKQFVVDRLAMGYSEQAIAEMFCEMYGQNISHDDIRDMSEKFKDDVIAREKELLSYLETNSLSIEGRLESLYAEVKEVLEELKKNKQWKQYASVLNGLLKNLELLAKSLGRLRAKSGSESKVLIQKNNYKAILLLADDGIISVKDKNKLKKLLGLEEDEEYVEGEIYGR